MGRTKMYTEPESDSMQGFRSNNMGVTKVRDRKRQFPGQSAFGGGQDLSLEALLQLLWQRIVRSWWALRFKVNRYTLGMFERRNVGKLALLLALSYGIYWANHRHAETATASGPNEEEGISIFGMGEAKPQKTKYKTKNDAAPIGGEELFAQEARSYIERFSKIAQTEQEKFGIPASISLAQGLIESRAGSSKLAKNNNNHFGIKCFSRNCKKGHCSNFTDDTHKDFFRKFENPWESWREHSKMLARGRYAKLKKYGTDYKKWAYGLKANGYATDRTYAEKLINVIERYDLHRFD